MIVGNDRYDWLRHRLFLQFPSISTPASAPRRFHLPHPQIILPHLLHHPLHLRAIWTSSLMLLDLLPRYKMQSIESASSKQMPNLLPILASIDMKYELLPIKDVTLIEGAAGLVLVLTLPEHQIIQWTTWHRNKAIQQDSWAGVGQDIFDYCVMEVEITDDPVYAKKVYEELRNNVSLDATHSLEQREKALKGLLAGYEKFKPEIEEALHKDLGYSSFLSNFAAHSVTLGEIEDLLGNFKEWARVKSIKTPMALGLASCQVKPEPLGLALVISAWNYPIYTSLPQVAAAISAGNSVLLKPSELSPYCSRVLKKLFDQFMDPRFYRVVEGKIEVAKILTQQKFDIICFTGSTQTGRLVAIQAAKNLTPCILELGGKCPVIVDESADLQSASKRIIFGKYLNCGQTCVGVDHLYVHEKIYEKFKKIFLSELEKAFGAEGKPSQPGDYGKINNIGHFRRLKRFYEQQHGGKKLYGGVLDESKLQFGPTVIQKPSLTSSMMRQQIFGPILPIQSYSNLNTLVSQFKSKAKPLVVYIYSSNSNHIELVRNRTSSGAFVVNDSVVQLLNCHLPFGGVGESGYGRYHGESGFLAFSNLKSIVNSKPFDAFPLSTRFFPFDANKKRVMTFLLKIGGTTYSQLGRGAAVLAVIAAAGMGYLKLRPFL